MFTPRNNMCTNIHCHRIPVTRPTFWVKIIWTDYFGTSKGDKQEYKLHNYIMINISVNHYLSSRHELTSEKLINSLLHFAAFDKWLQSSILTLLGESNPNDNSINMHQESAYNRVWILPRNEKRLLTEVIQLRNWK